MVDEEGFEEVKHGNIHEQAAPYRFASSGGQSNSSCRPQ